MKSVLCIGGVDPSGGAGLSADLKTLAALDVHGLSAVTAVTVQNSQSFSNYQAMPAHLVREQICAAIEEHKPQVIKVGLIPNSEVLTEVFKVISTIESFVIYDPVLATSSGFQFPLQKQELISVLKHVDLLTPNVAEAQFLFGPHQPTQQALQTGLRSLLLKGGHGKDIQIATDSWSDGEKAIQLSSERRVGDPRGTGCTLATAIAGFYRSSESLIEAILQAKSFLNQSINSSRYLKYQRWPQNDQCFPWLGTKTEPFPRCGDRPLGFYPIVDDYEWVKRLLPIGVKTLQLRIKENSPQLEKQIEQSIQLAQEYDCRLFINDHWQLAIKHGAYGVHLGHEDLKAADMSLLRASGLRLGLSSHSFEEAAIAHSFSPSYMALGPIYPTTSKIMPWQAQGLERVRLWSQMLPYPIVAIGGLTPQRAKLAMAAGADGVAVISDITHSSKPIERAKEWLSLESL